MNPPLLPIVTWEDPEIPIYTNDSATTGGKWFPHPPDVSIHILDDPWTINGSPHLPFYITSLTDAQICAYTGPQWYMNNIKRPPKSESRLVTIKHQTFVFTAGLHSNMTLGMSYPKPSIPLCAYSWVEMDMFLMVSVGMSAIPVISLHNSFPPYNYTIENWGPQHY